LGEVDVASHRRQGSAGDRRRGAAPESLVAPADRRMYAAKATGKNRVAGDEASAAPMPEHANG
jgi:GGDEF domain-containing protein